MENNQSEVKHSGFIAIVGKPNVGKSTLLNKLIGEKIAIVSSKPQTTRSKITGVLTDGGVQMIFVDTPGLHRSHTKLDEHMRKAISDSLSDVDAAILMVEPQKEANDSENELIAKITSQKIPAVLAVNKIDTVKKEALIETMGEWSKRCDFSAVVPICASTGDGIDILLGEIKKLMPEGPRYFPDDMMTDQPERLIIAEIVREKLLLLLTEEVPHGIAVTVERMKEKKNIVDIECNIYCEKESHKGIIIGKGGRMLKTVGINARADIEKLLDCHVNLKLWVKVNEDWRNRENIIKNLGFD